MEVIAIILRYGGFYMHKGFTLIEMLIVIIIVALLVSLSVPKYKTAMEKARAQEGITNLTLAADQANGFYMSHEGTYSGFSGNYGQGADKTKQVYFNTVGISGGGESLTLSIARKTGAYTLGMQLSGGKVSRRTCTGDTRLCDAIGWE